MQIFANAVKDRQNQLAKSNTVQQPDIHDNTSCDLFDDDDEIVPETQEVLTQINSEDSGESVRIPFYDKKNTCGSESPSKHTDDSDNESEYMQVRPESNVIEPVADEPQSQFIMANMDRSLMHDLEMSALTQRTDQVASDSDDTTLTEIDLAKKNTQQDENAEKNCYDRSGSTTPDLDFLIGAGQENDQETNGKSEENQQNSESIFEKSTQQFGGAETSTEDIFAVPTQLVPVFKIPAAVTSTPKPIAKSISKPLDESIYDADTQLPQQQQQQEEEGIFDVLTQIFPLQKQSTTGKSNNHTSNQNNQEEHEKSGNFLFVISNVIH